MIIRSPSAGDWTKWLMSHYDSPNSATTTTIEESEDVRASAVLGPDGKPFMLQRRKQKIGFIHYD